jgi:hypothetical protein
MSDREAHPALEGEKTHNAWTIALPRLLAEYAANAHDPSTLYRSPGLLELYRMADVADRVQESLAWADLRIARLEMDVALGRGNEGAVNITQLIATAASDNMGQVFYAAAALSRPLPGSVGVQEYLIVSSDRADRLIARGEHVEKEFFGLCVWIRTAKTFPEGRKE